MKLLLLLFPAFSPLTTSTHWWLRLLLWLVFGFGILSGIITAARERLKENFLSSGNTAYVSTTGPITNWPLRWRRTFLVITGEKATRQASKISILTLGLFLGFMWGFGYRDHVLNNAEQTYWDVDILEQFNERTFQVQPARMQDYKWEFCNVPPFRKGQVYKFITYEQQDTCKRLEYFRERDTPQKGKVNASLSAR